MIDLAEDILDELVIVLGDAVYHLYARHHVVEAVRAEDNGRRRLVAADIHSAETLLEEFDIAVYLLLLSIDVLVEEENVALSGVDVGSNGIELLIEDTEVLELAVFTGCATCLG